MSVDRRTIVFGVTIDYQLRYHDGLYQRLVDEGWDVHLVSGEGPIGDRLETVNGVTVHRLAMARKPSPFEDLRSLIKWVKLMRGIRPDIAVVGTPKAGLLGAVATRLTRVPYRIYELHGLRLESARGAERKLLRAMERITCDSVTSVIAVGPSLRRRALGENLARPEKIDVLGGGSPSGVQVHHFATAKADLAMQRALRGHLAIAEGESVLIYVGRLNADKGLDILSDALPLIDGPLSVHLLVLGTADDESGQVLERRLRASASRVTFVGDVDDVAPYLAIADALCLPSRREGLPTVILEAFASRLPVVATAATGIVDLVDDGVTGALVPADNPRDLAQALSVTLGDLKAAGRMADASHALVRENYDREIVERMWVAELARAARQHQKGRTW